MEYRVSIATVLVAMLMAIAAAQQPPQSATQQNTQPGRLWSEDELQRFARAVRAGRKLTPNRWPNGARIAVALTFTLNNSASNFARGDATVDLLTGGEFGARRGLPRVLDVLDRHRVPATFFIAATAAIVDPTMVPARLERREPTAGE
jgi:hypothetical protein